MNPLKQLWDKQSCWSQAANTLKSELERRRLLILGLTTLGAVASAAAVVAGLSTTGGRALAGVSAFAVAAAGVVRGTAGKDAIRNWTRARSVSEAIKAEVYTYMSGVLGSGADQENALIDRVDALERSAADLLRDRDRVTPVPRDLPPVHDVGSYITERVEKQINGYYRPQARTLEGRVTLFRRLEVGLGFVGAALAAAAAATGTKSVGVWVPVVTTVVTALAVHASAGRWDYQLVEYLRTAAELERLRDRRGSAAQLSDRELVQAAERVISIENEGWMAKLQTEDGSAGAEPSGGGADRPAASTDADTGSPESGRGSP